MPCKLPSEECKVQSVLQPAFCTLHFAVQPFRCGSTAPGKTVAVPQLARRIMIAQSVALLALLTVVILTELEHWKTSQLPGANWFFGIYDTTIPLLLVLCLPYFWFVRRPFLLLDSRWWQQFTNWWGEDSRTSVKKKSHLFALAVIAATSLWGSARTANLTIRWDEMSLLSEAVRNGVLRFDREEYRLGDLPPAYHDEFSYLFQARTYRAGRLSFESHPHAARLFDQMHVLNEGRFASRYFPATGLWIAPWLWLNWPILGHWLAGAATCMLVFGIGRELTNNGTGFVAGMLLALSPGMALFGNLLLAHHPTLLGLSIFAWSFLRWLRRGRVSDAAFAGIGLSWAMLCRPMTAAGFGLPFGMVFVWQLWTRHAQRASERSAESQVTITRSRFVLAWPHLLAMALPLLAGYITFGVHNRAITGSVTTSPYQLFTDVYTPRHGYGFNNVVRGEQHLGPRVLDQYDRWAKNLTPSLALENTKIRLLAAWQWTVGLVPLLAAVVVFVIGHLSDGRWWLILSASVSLFAVHVPYWFDGMFHWHYVFETGPLWCLLLASASDTLGRSWLAADRPRMPVWWGLLVASAVAVNVTEFVPFWFPSKLVDGAREIAFAKLKYQAFDELLRRDVRQRPALVLIEADPADRHIDYIVNEPDLSAEILRGRYPVPDWPLERIVAAFPDRTVYLFRAQSGELRQIGKAAPRVTENGE